MMGVLNPQSSEIGYFFFYMILAVYLGHRDFHPVRSIIILSLKSGFVLRTCRPAIIGDDEIHGSSGCALI